MIGVARASNTAPAAEIEGVCTRFSTLTAKDPHDFQGRRRAVQEKPSEVFTVHLTSRKVEILRLISNSHCNKEIAKELGISIKTVERHRGDLMKKLNVHDTAGLTRSAIYAGIIKRNVQITIV